MRTLTVLGVLIVASIGAIYAWSNHFSPHARACKGVVESEALSVEQCRALKDMHIKRKLKELTRAR